MIKSWKIAEEDKNLFGEEDVWWVKKVGSCLYHCTARFFHIAHLNVSHESMSRQEAPSSSKIHLKADIEESVHREFAKRRKPRVNLSLLILRLFNFTLPLVTILVSTITQITSIKLVRLQMICLRWVQLRLCQAVWILQTPLREEEGDVALLYHHLTMSTTNPENIENFKAQERISVDVEGFFTPLEIP